MTCNVVKLPGGGGAIICSRGPRPKQKRCACGAVATLLCDADVGAGKTCDKPLCARCTFSPGPELDYCPDHSNQKRLPL